MHNEHSSTPFHIRTDLLASLALFCLLAFAVLSPVFTDGSVGGVEAAGEGNLFRQLVYISIFGIALVCGRPVGVPWRLSVIPVSILLTLAWCALSIGWAINPSVGARRLFLTVIVVVSTFLLVDRSGYVRTLKLVRVLMVLVLLANYLAVVGWPDWAIHQATEADPSVVGAWRGVLQQKNFAGAACSLTVLFFLLDAREVRAIVRWTVIAAAGYFLFRTESKTSMALLAASAVVGLVSLRYDVRYRNVLLAVGAVLVLLIAFIVPAYWADIVAPFAREDTLTGRVQIWPPLFQFWREHWLLGSGFGSFWNIGFPEPIAAYTGGWVAQITSGHNGFLDLVVQIGLPGLLLALCAVIVAPMRVLLTDAGLDRSRRSLLTALVVFGVGHNLTESSLFDRDAAVHVFLMLAIALLAVETRSASAPADTLAGATA